MSADAPSESRADVLVENYRAQFNKLIAKDGFDGLLARMERKRAALKP